MTRRAYLAGLSLFVLLWAAPGHAGVFEKLFAPKAELWPRWTAHDESSTARIDHVAWGKFLAAYLSTSEDGIHRFDYGAVTEDDKAALLEYIGALAALTISDYARDEQRAYWINLYNALTVQVVLAYHPVESIRDIDISPGLFAFGPWDKKLVEIESERLSLNDIEHRILRPIWRDPRIHYALNCAALGCPNLQPVPFTAANAETLLEQAARAFVNHPRAAQVAGGRLTVNSIYLWFQDDFGGTDRAVIAHLKSFAAPPLAALLDAVDGIADHRYDWRLNDRAGLAQ